MNRFFLLFAILPFVLFAQWSNDPSINKKVSAYGVGAVAAADNDGKTIFAYRTDYYGNADILVSAINNNGFLLWNPDSLLPGYPVVIEPWFQLFGNILTDGKKGAYIIWTDGRRSSIQVPDTTDLYIQRVDSLGNMIFQNHGIRLNHLDAWSTAPLIVEKDGQDNCIVIWFEDGRFIPNYKSGLFAQKISPDGNFLWQEHGVLVDTLSDLGSRYKGLIFENKIIFAYEIFDSTWSRRIRFQVLNEDGSIKWPMGGKLVSEFGDDQKLSEIIKGFNDSYVISFNGEIYNDILSTTSKYLMLQSIDENANKLWGQNGIVYDTLINVALDLELDINKNDQYYIIGLHNIQQSLSDSKENHNKFYSLTAKYNFLDHSGNTIYPLNKSMLIDSSESSINSIFEEDNDFYVVLWKEKNNKKSMVLQKIQFGSISWPKGIVFTNRQETSFNSVIYDNNGGFILFWSEYGYTYGLYAQRMDTAGVLGPVTSINYYKNFTPLSFELKQNYPNPFNDQTIFEFYLPQKGFVNFHVYDINGKIVFKNKNIYSIGYNKLYWSPSNNVKNVLSSGVYFACFETVNTRRIIKMIYLK